MLDFFALTRVSEQLHNFFRRNDLLIVYGWSLWFAAAVAYAAGFIGLLYFPIVLIMIVPAMLLVLAAHRFLRLYSNSSKAERTVLFLLALTWLMHAVQVFTPETGFDALWYHLPVTRENTGVHRFLYQPALYQSANPQFSDGLLTLGYMAAEDMGVKFVAYMVALGLIGLTYRIALIFNSRKIALATVALVSTFQVISWQSASFYIDVAVGLWLCAGVYHVLLWLTDKKFRLLSMAGLFFGAALASKLFLVILPLMALICALLSRSWRYSNAVLYVSTITYIVAAPAYVFAWIHLGHPLFSLVHHTESIAAFGAGNSFVLHLLQRLISISNVLWQIGISRDYTTPLLLGFLPLAVWLQFKQKLAELDQALICFGGIFLSFWWFVPPLSTRYGLAGFILAAIFTVSQIARLVGSRQKMFLTFLLILTSLSVMPRIYVVSRSLQYITGMQHKDEYLAQFLDGNIDTVLGQWHSSVDLQN